MLNLWDTHFWIGALVGAIIFGTCIMMHWV